MQHISRIYVGNYGHKMCWYDGLVLSFLDPDSGLPCDHIIHLENGGGKSTLLSGIFSCFEPRENRFLKTLHDPRNKMCEYFREDGVPGFIIVEWQHRHEGNRSARRTVTGQAVALKNTLTGELERIFFHFESNEELNLDSLPVPKLCSTPVQNIRDFSSWLQRMKTKNQGNLFSTRNQNEWERSLEAERGIDIGLLKQQLEFSRQEGAVDTFLNFKTESEFLRKLLGLTIDQERAMSVRDSIAIACDRLRDKPKHERRLKILRECDGVLDLFAESAQGYETLRKEYGTIHRNAIELAFSLEGRVQRRHADREEKAAERSGIEINIASESERKIHLSNQLLGAGFEDCRRAREKAASSYELAKGEIKRTEERITKSKAARSYKEVLATEQRLAELSQLDSQAREQLEPFEREAKTAGSILKRILRGRMDDIKARESALNEEITRDKKELVELDEKLRRLSSEITHHEKQLSKLEAFEERYDSERSRLVKESVFQNIDESIESAQSRNRADLQMVETLVGQQETLLSELDKARDSLHCDIDALNRRHESAKSELAVTEEKLRSGRQLQQELSHDATLCAAADSDIADPELPGLVQKLDSAILQYRQQADLHAVALARLNSFKTEFESTGLAGANPDLSKLIRMLNESGVRSAVPFNEYIAQVVPDANQARALVGSNPSRFLGIGLQDESELKLARQILPEKLDIASPIMVSPTTRQPEAECDFLVIHPKNDAAFNSEAAVKFADELSDAIACEQQEQGSWLDKHAHALDARARLNQFLELYGDGRLGRLAERARELHNEMEHIAARVKELNCELERIKLQDGAARTSLKDCAEQIKALELRGHELRKFAENVDAPLKSSREVLSQARSTIERLTKEVNQASDSRTQIGTLLEDKRLQTQQLRHDAEMLRAESANVIHCYEGQDEHSPLHQLTTTLDAARDLYQDKAKLLATEEQQRLGLLGLQIDSCRRELAKLMEAYNRQFANVDSGEVMELIASNTDLDQALENFEADLKRLQVEAEGLRDELTLAENNFKQFKKKYPQAEQFAGPFKDLFEHDYLKERIADLERQLEACSSLIEHWNESLRLADTQLQNLSHEIDLLSRSLSQLTSTFEDYLPPQEALELDNSALPADPQEIDQAVVQITKEIKRITKERDAALRVVEKHFAAVQTFAIRPEVKESEEALFSYLLQNNLSESIANAGELSGAVKQRIAAVESVLSSLSKDFEESLEELVNLVGEGLHVLTVACSKRLPENAPYIGGKQVLKMRTTFPPSHAEARRQVLSSYMNTIIESGFPHKTGTDMVADAILQIANGSLGLQIVKLIRDPSEQYVAVNKLSNSGGEAVSMAMFLYLLIARVRADMQAKIRQQVGGPLILDNPFAKATSSFIWRTQRDLARSLGVQLIIATALPDYNALGEFDHFIHLRKSGQNNKTGRWHIEQAEFSFIGQRV